MLLRDIVDAVDTVTATSSRLRKVAALAALLGALEPDEIAVTVGLLLAKPRQGRLGVGWRGLTSLDTPHAIESTLTVHDVDSAFDRLAAAEGAGSAGARRADLIALSERATDAEWDFLARVLRGELRTGALEGVLLDAVASAADRDGATVRRAAMLGGDLGATARVALTEPPEALDAVGLVVGRPVLPMLASTAGSVTEAMASLGVTASESVTGTESVTGSEGVTASGDEGEDGTTAEVTASEGEDHAAAAVTAVSVEEKLDGARIQVHRDGDEVRVFTRTLADITHRVPEIVAAVRELPAERVILDGETLSLDEDGGPRPFQDTMARFGSDTPTAAVLRPWFFDILHLDGRDLIDEPLSLRRELLAQTVGSSLIRGIVTADPAAAEEFARAALAAGHEGVMVKALDATYAAGRRGKSWLKVKPVLTFDLVVLGVEAGSGRRQGLLSNLHLGARDPEGEFGEPGGFVMVGKTFKGLTDATLRWQTEHFPTIETHRTAYTVHVRPETVVEIAIDGVQRSSRYPGGVALRFARVKGYRPDKTPADADTIASLRALLRP